MHRDSSLTVFVILLPYFLDFFPALIFNLQDYQIKYE